MHALTISFFFFLNSANQDFLPCLLLRKKNVKNFPVWRLFFLRHNADYLCFSFTLILLGRFPEEKISLRGRVFRQTIRSIFRFLRAVFTSTSTTGLGGSWAETTCNVISTWNFCSLFRLTGAFLLLNVTWCR